jgi:hypothetical protein
MRRIGASDRNSWPVRAWRAITEGMANDELLEELPAQELAAHERDHGPVRSRWRLHAQRLAIGVIASIMIICGAVLSQSLVGASTGASAAQPQTNRDAVYPPSSFSWSGREQIDDSPPYAEPVAIDSLSCTSTTFCLATSEAPGQIMTSTAPTSGTPGSWSVLNTSLISEDATGYSLAGASCVTAGSTPFCLADGRNFNNEAAVPGVILTSTDPAAGASSWTPQGFPEGLFDAPTCAHGGATTLCMLVGGFEPALYASTEPEGGRSHWTKVTPPFTSETDSAPTAVSCPSTSFCAAVSYGGQFVESATPTTAASWSAAGDTGLGEVESLSCPNSSFCLAADPYSEPTTIATTTDPQEGAKAVWKDAAATAVSGLVTCQPDDSLSAPHAICLADGLTSSVEASTDGGQTWTAESIPGQAGLDRDAVSCTGESLCLAGTFSGAVSFSEDPAAGEAADWASPLQISGGVSPLSISDRSCPSSTLCIATDGAGRILTSTDPAGGGTTWTGSAPVDPGAQPNVVCPSSSLCVATDDAGNMLRSTDPSGGSATWSTPVSIDSSRRITDLACPSAELCVAVDEAGNVTGSTDPAAGASSWSKPASIDPGQEINSLECPSSTLCVAIDDSGNLLSSTDPAGGPTHWSAPANIDSGAFVLNLRCPSVSLCVAVDNEGQVLSSTDPAGGPATWSKSSTIDDYDYLTALDCPADNLCVATDGSQMFASANPAGGSGAWSASGPLGAVDSISALECPSASECLASDYGGDVFSSSDPAGPGMTWSTASKIDTASNLSAIACPSDELCVASDFAGDVFVGTGAAVPAKPEAPAPPPVLSPVPAYSALPEVVPPPTPVPPAAPAPIVGERQVAGAIGGEVMIRLKGSNKFVPLSGGIAIPNGSEVEATNGRVQITVALPGGHTVSAEVYAGRFEVDQEATGRGETRFILSLPLTGCPAVTLPHAHGAILGASAKRNGAKSRHLWVSEHGGNWGTSGRYVTTTVEGTHWLTLDDCNQSEVNVVAGKVKVHNLLTGKTKTIVAGRRYVAARR